MGGQIYVLQIVDKGRGGGEIFVEGKYRYTVSQVEVCSGSNPPYSNCIPSTCCPSYGKSVSLTGAPCPYRCGGACPTTAGIVTYEGKREEWQCSSCTNGQTIPCYSGSEETKNKGICKAGTQTCVNWQWSACVGEVLPQAEVCGDGKDNNCDGNKDEGCAVCEVSVKVVPAEVWPLIPKAQRPVGYKEDWTKADVVVTLSKPARRKAVP